MAADVTYRPASSSGTIGPKWTTNTVLPTLRFSMMNDDDNRDTDLSPIEIDRLARRPRAELALIDAALLSQVSDEWRKVARVVGMAMLSMPDRPSGVPDVFFAKRVVLLVESGRLEARGDLRRMRFSEVRFRPT